MTYHIKLDEAEELFDNITKTFVSDPKISQSKMFGSPGLKVGGKIFAFLVKGNLVLKLPKERINALVVAKEGNHFGHMFAPDNWRPMKEWIKIESENKKIWLELTQEARDFVFSKT